MDFEILQERRECLKCGYVRESSDIGPDYACPNCGAIYAKLEAIRLAKSDEEDSDKAEAAKFERRLELQGRLERDHAAQAAIDRPRYNAAHAVYLLMILPFAVTQALAIAIAIKMRRTCDDTWLNDHFNWQITTFWYLLGLSILAGAALLVGTLSFSAGVLFRSDGPLALSFKSLSGFAIICAVASVTAIYRIGKGWYRLSQRQAP